MTVPWEDRLECSNALKAEKYADLSMDPEAKGQTRSLPHQGWRKGIVELSTDFWLEGQKKIIFSSCASINPRGKNPQKPSLCKSRLSLSENIELMRYCATVEIQIFTFVGELLNSN